MMTHSVRYGKSVLAAAGYRVTKARIVLDDMGRLLGRTNISGWAGNSHSATETATEFMTRHGLKPDDKAQSFFTIVMDVEPF